MALYEEAGHTNQLQEEQAGVSNKVVIGQKTGNEPQNSTDSC